MAVLYSSNQLLNGDQLQTLYRGYLAAHQGMWLNYGNAASVVGNVPGSLSTLVVGVPLVLWDSPWAPMMVIIACNVVALVLFDKVIKQVFNEPARLFFWCCFGLVHGFYSNTCSITLLTCSFAPHYIFIPPFICEKNLTFGSPLDMVLALVW